MDLMAEIPPDLPDHFSLDPARYPRKVEIALPVAVAEWLAALSARTGRSQEELVLELLDRGLKGS